MPHCNRIVFVTVFLLLCGPISLAADWSAEKLADARDYSKTIDTAAVVVLHEGEVVDQWGPVALPLKCHSVRKSLLSALFGQHVHDGTIDLNESLADLGIDDNEPSLTSEEKTATVGDLLKARSGVYHPALYETAGMAARRPARGSHAPNTFWYYNNWDFNTLGAIFRQKTGQDLFEEFEQKLATPLRFQDFERRRDTRYVTGSDSNHPAYPFQLSTRDLARFGQLMLQKGRWKDQQLVPETWVAESTASYSDAGTSGGYGYMWWVAVDGKHLPGATLPAGSYSARGYRGQYLVIVPDWNLVVCHRVNTHQKGTSVSKTDFGKLLSMILAAMPETHSVGRPERGEPRQNESAEARVARPSLQSDGQPANFDILVRNGSVMDGTGKQRFTADIGINGNLIAAVGNLSESTAARVVNAERQIVCPGFIDMHSHAEIGLVHVDPRSTQRAESDYAGNHNRGCQPGRRRAARSCGSTKKDDAAGRRHECDSDAGTRHDSSRSHGR